MSRDEAISKYDSSLYLLKRLFKEHVKSQSKHIQIAVFCMFLISVTTAVNAWQLQPILDEIFISKNYRMLYIIPLFVILNTIIKGIATFFQSSIMKKIGQKIITDIQLRLYNHLIYADVEYLANFPSGKLISRFTNDIHAMRKSVSDVITGMVMEFFTLLGLIGVMFYQSTKLAIISLFIIPIAFLPIIKLGKRMRKIARNVQEELGEFTMRLDETFQNIRIIKSYCTEEYEVSRARKVINAFLKLYKRAAYIEAASSPIMEVLSGVAIAAIIWYGGAQVIEGQTTPGAFFSFITAILMAYKPLKVISQLNTSLQEGLAACRRLFIMLDEKPKIKDSSLISLAKFTGDIEFKNIFFGYKDDHIVLEDLNMMIPHGKTVALVGSSGGGKSTIFNLLQHFYKPDFGSIAINGVNINKISLKTLRSNMALVSQEIALFDATIKENILYGKMDATNEEMIDASLASAAHDFIINFPQGYDTDIGQKGIKLSGGQRQRIAIARAILKNAPILLLDEATSALDSISEKQVKMALDYLKQGRTTVIIAHRLSTIESADIIYVINDKKVAEFGTHEQLLSKGGEYSQLYEKYKSDET